MDGNLEIFLKAVIIFCACISIICFVRAVIGPTIPDRLVAINMIGTQMIIIISVLTILLKEAWLADVAAVYALLSFLGVVVLTKIYIGIYRKKHAELFGEEEETDGISIQESQVNDK
ncbi:MAG: sodium:proton antiporter [Lachnospiraceae bacterium]|nr:sodium:proton antiporter [Lachnospiraceae bacterium]MBR4780241.1 sodium:proton antiporter [Lachnospiraceae bacterium]MBR6475654.1 sodium:proton antiporter [Lachnospiraceae bacterium]